ncbi:MAG: DUF1634 domain-containing protein [Thermoplasmata archaeon]|jgi:uncharacterized membrane protein
MTAVSSPSSVEMPSVKPLPLDAYLRMTLVLRVGLGMALAILGGGIVAYTLENPNASSSSVLTNNPILSYLSLEGLGSGLASGAVGAFLTLGLIVLVATPIVRVLSGLYYFRRAGERTMTAITFAVFVLLIVGLLAIGPYVR